MAKVEVVVDENTNIDVTITNYTRGNLVFLDFENANIILTEEMAVDLHSKLEKVVTNEAYWVDTLQEEMDDMSDEIVYLKECLETIQDYEIYCPEGDYA